MVNIALLGAGMIGYLFLIILTIAASIWSMIQVATSKKMTDEQKKLWVILLYFTGIIGAAVFYFAVWKNKK